MSEALATYVHPRTLAPHGVRPNNFPSIKNTAFSLKSVFSSGSRHSASDRHVGAGPSAGIGRRANQMPTFDM